MFTINIYLKFALITVFLVGGIVLAFSYGFWYAFPLLLIGLGLLASYLLLGTVQSAAIMMQSMDFDACEKRINLTAFPKMLYVTNRAFYYIIKGTIALNRQDNEAAEHWFSTAETMKLPSDNERAMVKLQMANIHGSKGRWNQAKSIYRDVKKLKVTQREIKEQIKQFEKALQNQGIMKSSGGRRGQMMQPGGKRRRPKMR